METEILLNPQWQHSADYRLYQGAREIELIYLQNRPFCVVPEASANRADGPETIQAQNRAALDVLENDHADHFFTIGGESTADLASILLASERCHGDLAILWLDHTPCDLVAARAGLANKQGLQGTQIVTPRSFPATADALLAVCTEALQQAGKTYVYVHLGVTLLQAKEIPSPAATLHGGIAAETLLSVLHELQQQYRIAGASLTGYLPCGKWSPALDRILAWGETL